MRTARGRAVLRAALAAATVLLSAAQAAAGGLPAPGDPAPAIALPDLQGREVTLASLRGRAVLVHFWATWCPVCRDELPLLEEAARERSGSLTVLGVNLGEKRDKVAAYAREAGLTFPILLDGRGKVAARYGVLSLPITLVVGPDGQMAEQIVMGALDRDSLGAILKRRLPG